jgi:hypothetical protein
MCFTNPDPEYSFPPRPRRTLDDLTHPPTPFTPKPRQTPQNDHVGPSHLSPLAANPNRLAHFESSLVAPCQRCKAAGAKCEEHCAFRSANGQHAAHNDTAGLMRLNYADLCARHCNIYGGMRSEWEVRQQERVNNSTAQGGGLGGRAGRGRQLFDR